MAANQLKTQKTVDHCEILGNRCADVSLELFFEKNVDFARKEFLDGQTNNSIESFLCEEIVMLAKLNTFSLLGIEAIPVEVEVDVSGTPLA